MYVGGQCRDWRSLTAKVVLGVGYLGISYFIFHLSSPSVLVASISVIVPTQPTCIAECRCVTSRLVMQGLINGQRDGPFTCL